MKNIVIVSGPSCVGKSSFIHILKSENYPSLNRLFLLNDIGSWKCIDAVFMSPTHVKSNKDTVIHYDHNRIWVDGFENYDDDQVLNILCGEKSVIFITLWETPEILRRRCLRRLTYLDSQDSVNILAYKQVLEKIKLYENPVRLWRQYQRWFKFCDQYSSDRWVLRTGNVNELSKVSEYKSIDPLWSLK